MNSSQVTTEAQPHTTAMTARDSVLYFMARAAPAAVQLLVMVLAFRWLPSSSYLTFSLSLGLALTACSATSAWLNQALVRNNVDLGRRDDLPEILLVGCATIVLLPALPLLVVSGYLLHPLPFSPVHLLALYASCVAYVVGFHWQLGQRRPLRILIAELTRSLCLLVASAMVFLLMPANSAQWLLLATAGSFFAGALWMWPRLRISHVLRGAIVEVVRMFRANSMICFWFAASLCLFLVDRYVMNGLVDSRDLADYVLISDTLQRAAQLLFGPITLATQPAIARFISSNNNEDANKVVITGLALQFVVGAVVVLLFFLLTDIFFQVLVGHERSQAVAVFFPMVLTVVVWQLVQIVQKPLEYRGFLKTITGFAAISVLVALSGVWITVDQFGIVGAAWSLFSAVGLYAIAVLSLALIVTKKRAPA